MNRRGFLGAILAAGVAPVYIKYGSLMPLVRVSGATESLTSYQLYLMSYYIDHPGLVHYFPKIRCYGKAEYYRITKLFETMYDITYARDA